MRICSWNVLFRNPKAEDACRFVEESDADVFCLQEVPEGFLEKLRETSWDIAAAPEVDRLSDGIRVTHYGVILSRHPIRSMTAIPLPHRDHDLPLRERLFTRFMFWSGLFVEGVGNRHALYADIEMPGGLIRVLNIHLLLLNPAWRAAEFESAVNAARTDLPLIVCGDFNIIESPRVSILNWLLGGTFGDFLFWNRERPQIENVFAAHGLKNPLRSKSTHPLSHSQLDHILVPADSKVENAVVIRERFGSDHCPISVSVA